MRCRPMQRDEHKFAANSIKVLERCVIHSRVGEVN